MIKRIVLTAIILMVIPSIFAADFSANGVYYTIIPSTKNVEVTSKNKEYNSYSGIVTIPATVQYSNETYTVVAIGDKAFWKCSELTGVSFLSANVITLGNFAFSDCSKLAKIKLPDNLTKIGEYAFSNCSSLLELSIPKTVTNIGASAFQDCKLLTKVIISPLTPIVKIDRWTFTNCESLTELTIPSTVKRIDYYGIARCKSLKKITIPATLTEIGQCAFSYCTNLEQVIIPQNSMLTDISIDAFSGCEKLTSFTIPSKVQRIYSSAFSGAGLTSIYAYPTTPVDISKQKYVFLFSKYNCNLYVPEASIQAYKDAPGWNEFGNILPIPPAPVTTKAIQKKPALKLRK